MGTAGELIVFLVAVTAIAVVGLRLGMLLAPRINRLTETDDEDDGDRSD